MCTRGSNPTIKDSTTRVLYSISSLDARRVDGTGSPLFFSTWASFRRFYFDVARRSRRLRPERPASVDRCCNRIRYRYVVKLVTVYPASLLRLRIARFVGHETEAKTPLCIYDPIKRTVRRNIYISSIDPNVTQFSGWLLSRLLRLFHFPRVFHSRHGFNV